MQEKKVMNRCLFAGCQEAELVDDQMGITFPMIVMYPTSTPEKQKDWDPTI